MKTRTVEVFKTNVGSREVANQILIHLCSIFDGAQISFDLEDVDRVLRIATSTDMNMELVVAIVGLSGHKAEALEDTVAEPSAS